MDDWFLLKLEQPNHGEVWEPGFEAGRCLVHTQLRVFQRLRLRPPGFLPRFYHKLYPLPVETWLLVTQASLHGGLCSLEINLKIRFQATLRYVENNPESLPNVNNYIRSQMETLIVDAVEGEIIDLQDGGWLDTGLTDAEMRIATAINETLAIHHIQCRTHCQITPRFKDLHGEEKEGFVYQEAYLKILQRQLEFEQSSQREFRRRHEEKLKQELAQFRLSLDNACQKQSEQALHEKNQLQAQYEYNAQQQKMEAKLHQQKLIHQTRLEEMALERKIMRARKRREVELQLQSEKAAHLKALQDSERQIQKQLSESRLQAQRERVQMRDQEIDGYEKLLNDIKHEAAGKLRDKDQVIASLEAQLEEIRALQQNSTALATAEPPVNHSWLDRLAHLTGRLLFFYRNRG